MPEAENWQHSGVNEDWSYRRADWIAHVKKTEEGWAAMIGKNKPIGCGFTKYFSSRQEAIHFASDYFSKIFGK